MKTLYRVCIDDTCDAGRKDFICAGALMGKVEGWSTFNKEWRKALRAEPAIGYWHGKDLPTLRGPFLQFRNKQLFPLPTGMDAAVSKRTALQKVIEESALAGFGVGVLISDYERIRESHPRAKTFMAKDAFEYILQELVYRTSTGILAGDQDAKIAFISDLSGRSKVYELVYNKWKMSNPKTAKSMLAITHDDDKTHYGLQGADMIASVVNRIYRAHLKDGIIPEEYPLSSVMWRIGRIDEKYLLTMLGHQSVRPVEQALSTPSTGQIS